MAEETISATVCGNLVRSIVRRFFLAAADELGEHRSRSRREIYYPCSRTAARYLHRVGRIRA